MTTPKPHQDPHSKWDDSEFLPRPQVSWWQQHRRELIGFSVLLLILIVVVFWLPTTLNSSAEQDSTSPTGASSASSAAHRSSPSSGPINSPWQDAQLAKARHEAQEILAKLLEQQKALEAMQVQLWAADAYQTTANHATRGDELYRQRDFLAAQSSYQTALEQFETLTTEAEQQFQHAMADGEQAILDRQPQSAVDAYTLATAIRPDSDEAQAGLARAQVQDAVIEQLEAADQQIRLQQYALAKAHLTQALELDSQSQVAADKLTQVQQAINDNDFANAMGRGYNLLQQQQYNQAAVQFKQALALKPGDAAAQDGVVQASNQQTQAQIQQALQQAASFEAQEQWQQALSRYQAAQKLGDSVVAARVGVLRTQARAQLDQQLQHLIDQPLRLSDAAVYHSAQQLLADAALVKPRGPRIEQQQQQLQQALSQAQKSVAVMLRSDNQTRVTLYKLGELGNFKEHTLELKPGHYTLVGSRNGYRDVRKEFTLQPGAQPTTIVIQCAEKIALGR